MAFFSVPNLLSLLRLPLAALFPLVHGTAARAAILGAAVLSDWLDGRIARRQGRTSRVGALLDPVTDRIFVVAVLATFLAEGTLRPIDAALLLMRDAVTTLAFVLAAPFGLRIRFQARFPGKVVTSLQLLALAALLLRPAAIPLIAVVVAAASLVAIADYAVAAVKTFRREDADGD